jgi:peptidoglycan/xylan/chitin deacetylase (PgdA/CDA1 family)
MVSPAAIPDALNEATPAPPGLFARLSHRAARHMPMSSIAMAGGPLVSFTFDDIPESAHTEGARILEQRGVRGTFYVAGGLMGGCAQHWRVAGPEAIADLHARGHEIACHSYSHKRADAVHGGDIGRELARNRERLSALAPTLRIQNFAYPYGYASLGWKRELRKVFQSSRGVLPSVNHGSIDLHFLRAFPLTCDASAVDAILNETVRTKGWTIFYTHDVSAKPSPYGCTPDLLEHALDAAQRRGIACTAVACALHRIGAA